MGEKLKIPGAKHETLVANASPKPESKSTAKAESGKSAIAAKNPEVAVAEKPHVR